MSDEDFAKITYVAKDGLKSQAYVDLKSGTGVNKHTDIPIEFYYDEESDEYRERYSRED